MNRSLCLLACLGVFLFFGLAAAQEPPGPLAFPEENPAEKDADQDKDKAMEKVLGPHSYSVKDFQAEEPAAKNPETTPPSTTSEPPQLPPTSEKSPPAGGSETKSLPPTADKAEPVLPGANPEAPPPLPDTPAKAPAEILPFAPTPVKPAPDLPGPSPETLPATPAKEPVLEKEPKDQVAEPASNSEDTAVQGKKDPKDKTDPKDKKDPKKGIDVEKAPIPEMFAQAPSAESEGPEGMNPHMIGDIFGLYGLQTITRPILVTITPPKSMMMMKPPPPYSTIVPFTTVAKVPVAFPGSFKIGENESPVPMDRVFFTFNYFGNIHGPDLPTTGTIPFMGETAKVRLHDALPPPTLDLYREVFGFEKTFLDGAASVGMRVPLFQERGDSPFQADEFGDITLIGKYALWRDQEGGNLVSAGLALTVPSGPRVNTIDGDIHPVLIQPYGGYIFSVGDLYLHGFLSVVVPTDSNFPTLLFNDIGVGYWLYRGDNDSFLRSIVPTFETHVTTPLNDRSAEHPITIPDLVVLTAGVHLDLARRSRLTMGVATPVTGPHTFSVEAIAQFNWLF